MPDVPRLLVHSRSHNTMRLHWSAVEGATGYDVERNGEIIVWRTPHTSYVDRGLKPETEYTYRVRAVFDPNKDELPIPAHKIVHTVSKV